MAKIKAFELPLSLAERLKAQIPDFPKDYVSAFGRDCLSGGYRNPAAIRERLCAFVDSSAAFPPDFVALLATCVRHRSVVKILSEAGIETLFDFYANILNREDLLIAILVDSREEVYRLGIKLQKTAATVSTEEDRNAAREMIDSTITHFLLEPVGLQCTESSESSPFPPEIGEIKSVEVLPDDPTSFLQQHIVEQGSKIAELQKELERERAKHKRKQEESQKRLTEEKQKLVAERDAEKLSADNANAELIQLKAEQKALEVDFEERVANRVMEETSRITRKWLDEAAATEAEPASSPNGNDLLTRCENLLLEQQQRDHLTGNRIQLQSRLSALETMRSRILDALSTALNPLTSLRGILPDIEAEIAAIRRRLTSKVDDDGLTRQFLAYINSAESWDDVRWFSRLVEDLAEKKFVSPEASRKIANQLHRKISVLEDRFRAPAPEVDTGWSLRRRIHRNEPTLILIDGHNALFGLPDIFGPCFEEGSPRKKARDTVVACVKLLVNNRGSLFVRLFFDGPESNVQQISPNLSVEYSGGIGSNRADGCIAQHLLVKAKELTSIDQKRFVVSDDRDVRREALAAGAKFVPLNIFAVLLQDFGCLRE